MRERELVMIHEMNKKIKITIDTPVGRTEEFTAQNIVKQGSVCATKLCCSSTGKVNEMSPQSSYNLTPDMKLQAIVYVDDIAGAGNKEERIYFWNRENKLHDNQNRKRKR